ncbi:hypothetical protein HJD18_03395 [Thermoleophilia bacterium SCSIO 60948]|nr:hypothetical protein HJD18_03395 [Thermoleophilia bacterium SCSIO 60948]
MLKRELLALVSDGSSRWESDERDLLVALAPFYDCARRLDADPTEVFDAVAAEAPGAIADCIRCFGRRGAFDPNNWDFYVVPATDGEGYFFDKQLLDLPHEWLDR